MRSDVLPIAFDRRKYGREMLVDAAFISEMPLFNRTERPHRLDFFDILLVTKGRGSFVLDDRIYPVSPGTVFFSRPGDIRQWRMPAMDGAVLFFAPDFFSDVFRDARFLDQFACFHRRRPSSAIQLRGRERRQFLVRFSEMQREIKGATAADEPHVLRAITYQLLALLTRAFIREHGIVANANRDDVVEQFRALIEERFAREHGVDSYARRLGVTPRYLNDRCRRAGLESAGTLVHHRIALEARRLLLYTSLPVSRIGRDLGFADPAYFARFFARECGLAPSTWRSSHAGSRLADL